MILQEGKHISEFNEGDIITRVKPAIIGERYIESNFVTVKEDMLDYSMRGEPLRFLGIANNMIYYNYVGSKIVNADKVYDVPMERGWADGWDYYIDIKELNNFKPNTNEF